MVENPYEHFMFSVFTIHLLRHHMFENNEIWQNVLRLIKIIYKQIETNKIIEQNKFLKNQELQAENEMRYLLLLNDKTEFAEQNLE